MAASIDGNVARRRRAPAGSGLSGRGLAGSTSSIGGNTIGSNNTRFRNRSGWRAAAINKAAPPLE